MSFFAIVFALLLEQVRPLLLDNPVHRAAFGWTRTCARSLDAGRSHHGWLVWSAVVLIPALIALAVHHLFIFSLGVTGYVLVFAWHVFVLYACLGFRQFSHHFTAIRDALDEGDQAKALRLLAAWKRVDPQTLSQERVVTLLVEHSVVAAHRHVFAVLGWYAVLAALGLGPAGAVLYRMAEFASRYFNADSREDLYGSMYQSLDSVMEQPAREKISSPSSLRAALLAWHWIDFIPARATAIAFAIVGNFEEVIDAWRGLKSASTPAQSESDRESTGESSSSASAGATAPEGLNTNDALIQMAMTASLNAQGQSLRAAHLRSVVGLVWRVVVLWLLLIALLTLANLLG